MVELDRSLPDKISHTPYTHSENFQFQRGLNGVLLVVNVWAVVMACHWSM